MKKLLAILLSLMLVFSLATGIIVSADEVEQQQLSEEEMQDLTEDLSGEEPVEPTIPEGVDESTILQYLVFDFSNKEIINVNSYITANDATLDYYKEMYESYGQSMEDTEYDGTRALSLGVSELEWSKLASAGVGYVEEKTLFGTKQTFAYVCGDMLDQGFEEGTKVAVIVFEFGNKTEKHEIVAGQQNSFIVTNLPFNWFNFILTLLCVALIVVIIVLVTMIVIKKKKNEKKEVEEEYIDESDAFAALVAESAEETVEEIQEAAEEVEESTEEK